MPNQELIDYIKSQLKLGRSEDIIKSLLKNAGWQDDDIEEGFNIIKSDVNTKGVTTPIFNKNIRQQIQRFESPEIQSSFKSHFFHQESKFSRKRLFINISIIIFILTIGGIASYFLYFNTPKFIFSEMIFRLAQSRSLSYSVELKSEISDKLFVNQILSQASSSVDMLGGMNFSSMVERGYSKDGKVVFSLIIKGFSDFNNLQKQKHDTAINISCETCVPQKKIAGTLKIIDNTLYAKFNELPKWGAINFNFLTADWIRFDMASGTESFLSETFSNRQNKDKISDKEALSKEQLKELRKIYKQYPLFKVIKMSSEEIEGIKTHHLKAELIEENFKNFLLSAVPIIRNKSLNNEEITDLDEVLKDLESLTGEIWISKKDFLPYKALFLISSKENGNQEFSSNFSINMFLKNFNKEEVVSSPASSKELFEFFKNDLFLGVTQIPNFWYLLENQDMDLDGISNIDEKNIYEMDYLKSDSDKDGIKDGEDIYEELKNNILNNSGKIKIYKNNINKYGVNSLKKMDEIRAEVLYNPELYLPKETVASLITALSYRKAGNFQKSLEELDKIPMQAVNVGAIYHGLGLTYFGMNDFNKALEFYEKAFKDANYKDNSPFLYYDLFSVNNRLGIKEKALQYLNDGIINFSNYLPFYYWLVEYHIENNNLGVAEEIIKQGLVVAPLYSEFWNYLGVLADKKNESNKAFEYYKKAISLDWENATPHMNLSLTFRDNLKKPKEALIEALIADMFDSSNAHIKNVLGLAYEVNDNLDAAIKEYKKAIQLDHFYERPYNNLGVLYGKLKQYALTEQYLKKLIEINPKYIKAYNNLGYNYLNQGRHKEAIFYLKKAIELDPKWFLPYQNLGYAYWNSGNPEEAIKQWKIALSLGLQNEEIKQIIENYKK